MVLLASTFLLAVFFLFLYRLKRQEYLLAWATAWLFLSLHFVSGVIAATAAPAPWLRWDAVVSELVLAMSALAFYCAARLYAGLKIPVPAMIVASVLAAAWPVVHAYRLFNVPPIVLGMGLIFIFVGQTFWQEGRKQEARADVLLALTFIAWGLLCISGAFRNRWTILQGVDLLPLMILPELFTCVLMVMAVYEEERRRVERNMLALSSLNLATSSFVGGELQKMLAQALERVLNVVRIPVGALCLQHDGASAPTTVIGAGLGDTFCSAIRENHLDLYIVNLVARPREQSPNQQPSTQC